MCVSTACMRQAHVREHCLLGSNPGCRGKRWKAADREDTQG